MGILSTVSNLTFLSAAFGLRIATNVLVPGLRCAPSAAVNDAPDIEIWLGDPPHWADPLVDVAGTLRYASARRDVAGRPVLTVLDLTGSFVRFQYADGVTFLLDAGATRIWASWRGETSLDDAAVYLLGPILGYALRVRGVTCLHASVIAVDGRAIALVGCPRAGKSTTAAAFAGLRYPVLSDDIAALFETDGTHYVRPAYPQLRLWPDSVERLFGARDALRPLTPLYPQWDKRFLSLNTNGGDHLFCEQSLPLAAVYILSARETGDLAPRIEAMPPSHSVLQMIANTYTSYLATVADQRRELAMLRGLGTAIPVRKAVPNADPARLPDLCSAILADLAAR